MILFIALAAGLSANLGMLATRRHVFDMGVESTWSPWITLICRTVATFIAGGLTLHIMYIYPVPAALALATFSTLLIVLAVIDAETMLLPDVVTMPLLTLGLVVNAAGIVSPFSDALLGALLGYIIPRGVSFYYERYRGKNGLGLGDVKLLAALGAWLGWQALPMVAVLASFIHLLPLGLVLLTTRRWRSVIDNALPFGPALALAGIALAIPGSM